MVATVRLLDRRTLITLRGDMRATIVRQRAVTGSITVLFATNERPARHGPLGAVRQRAWSRLLPDQRNASAGPRTRRPPSLTGSRWPRGQGVSPTRRVNTNPGRWASRGERCAYGAVRVVASRGGPVCTAPPRLADGPHPNQPDTKPVGGTASTPPPPAGHGWDASTMSASIIGAISAARADAHEREREPCGSCIS